jgi:hypothetical protein
MSLQVPYVAYQLNTAYCDHKWFCKLLPFSLSAVLLTVSQLHGPFYVYFFIGFRHVMELANKHCCTAVCLVFMYKCSDLAAHVS